ncbi:GNAT family N-acetyltransferase [Phytomonospora endophytica]|uniref:GNAT superfamily N-acetyltransferase n=1 Tax=Phytomonospora endophytica TaxID=714109 RepID=A0A841FG39_9ACTN|nr:GNAT family N-acetyltransferase [Phytomonospora endophytica]MBB6034575.1 GNAT superfamily N-acetyltransferase [Phytomonospora endophytica]
MPIQITALTDPEPRPSSFRLAWLAAGTDGAPTGSAYLRLFTREGQDHLAELDVAVHPAERRRGVGTALLERALDGARGEARRSVTASAEADSDGAAFLTARGGRKVLAITYARLALADADLPAIAARAARPHPGYRLVSWDGTVSDELARTFADSRRAMDDMPMDDTDYGTVVWDVARVREIAAAIEKRGEVLHTVAAVAESDGTIAGFTELVVAGDGEGDGQHYGTGVLPEHRGHGLGSWMKAEAIRLAREAHPNLSGLLTDTADSNTYMRAVNDRLGYAPTHKTVTYQFDL